MITFDKIKLVTNIEYIRNVDETKFEIRYNDYDTMMLFMEIDYDENELVIEFSGKILGKDYPQLISRETIIQCLENINMLGVCEILVEDILKHSEVVKCDVTMDIQCDDIAGLASYINGNVKSHRQYVS